nr:reverse transcriptase domain-containing protein [Tanacetum cinerariifolium]
IAIRVHWCRPMRNEEIACWDGGKSTWGGRVRVFGTVSVCVRVQEKAGGEGRVLARRFVEGTVGPFSGRVVEGQVPDSRNGLLHEVDISKGGERNKNWVEELPHVLWAHRTMIKLSHGDTPFSITYGTEAVIPAEIGMPTYRTAAELAAISEAKSKSKMMKYYNARVRGVAFKPEDFVYRSNDASHVVAGGKLGPKWEGPYETMANSSLTTRSRTPFSLTYGTEAVIPAEIGMPTYRTAAVDVVNNDEELSLNLDLLEERRELAAISEAKSKSKMMKYYNARVRCVAFKPGDFVYRSNDASHVVAGGKLGPKWEGPYEVTDALGNRAYKPRSTDGTMLPRTWNVTNLKRCYL